MVASRREPEERRVPQCILPAEPAVEGEVPEWEWLGRPEVPGVADRAPGVRLEEQADSGWVPEPGCSVYPVFGISSRKVLSFHHLIWPRFLRGIDTIPLPRPEDNSFGCNRRPFAGR